MTEENNQAEEVDIEYDFNLTNFTLEGQCLNCQGSIFSTLVKLSSVAEVTTLSFNVRCSSCSFDLACRVVGNVTVR